MYRRSLNLGSTVYTVKRMWTALNQVVGVVVVYRTYLQLAYRVVGVVVVYLRTRMQAVTGSKPAIKNLSFS